MIQQECPDCGVAIGTPHHDDCDIERCSACGEQKITCGCKGHDQMKSVWTGDFPKPKNVAESLALSDDNRIDATPSQCYYNAFKTIFYCPEYKYATYVEGVAVEGGLMLEHGWIEKEGEIIDPTLPTANMIYFPGLHSSIIFWMVTSHSSRRIGYFSLIAASHHAISIVMLA